MDDQTNARALLALWAKTDASAGLALFLIDLETAWQHVDPALQLRAQQAAHAREHNGALDFTGTANLAPELAELAAHAEADAGRGPCPFGGFGVCGYCTERAAGPEAGR